MSADISEIKAQLEKPLEQERVKFRDAGRGAKVPYLEGYDVIDAANRIFGFDGWSYEVESVGLASTFEVQRRAGNVSVTLYEARVRVTALGVTRLDVGTNLTSDDRPESHDTSIKGAVTDALKRALRTFGSQFGNDLYDKGNGQQRESAPENRPQQQRAQSNGDGQLRNVGDLLTWAIQKHQKNRAWVFDVLGVSQAAEIKDLADAKAALEIAIEGGK